jgi:energy-coupling factor transporter ATP-binding protein EcfA2
MKRDDTPSPSNPDSTLGKCHAKMLSDSPSDNDEFGSHERVARALKEIILNDDHGQATALIGSWGSGKSTIIRILQGMLSKNESDQGKQIKLLQFDVWAHEGDPLRRSFLERLINSLIEWGWVPEDKWKKKLGELAGKVNGEWFNFSKFMPNVPVLREGDLIEFKSSQP